jgi:hypothetical protein
MDCYSSRRRGGDERSERPVLVEQAGKFSTTSARGCRGFPSGVSIAVDRAPIAFDTPRLRRHRSAALVASWAAPGADQSLPES